MAVTLPLQAVHFTGYHLKRRTLETLFFLYSLSDDLKIPSYDHYKVDWTLGPSVLVIGGETAGLGEIIKNIARQRKGQIVRVPMATPIDSLSAAIAGTVIIYEAYRQTVSAGETENWANDTKKWQL